MAAENLRYPLEEFYALPEGTHAELINGVIYNMAPPKRIHQEISHELSVTIDAYIKKNKGSCKIYEAPFGVKLSEDSLVEPDISVICDRSKLTDDGCEGAPDWIIEITSSNASHDYVTKLKLYMEHGVREYWIVDPEHKTVIVYTPEHGMNICKLYQFSDTITAGIYKNNPEPLEICIADLIADFNET